MARQTRFELVTPSFEGWCSIQLSYWRALLYYMQKRVSAQLEKVAEATISLL